MHQINGLNHMILIALYCLGAPIYGSQTLVSLHQLPIPTSAKKSLTKEIYAASTVKTDKKTQSLILDVAGLHTKSCTIALAKISQYERYQDFIGFISKSDYNDETKTINLQVSHMLMPFDMYLLFNIDRVIAPGNYPFTFHQGFLKGLKGVVRVAPHKKRCLFHLGAHWKGPVSKIPDKVFSFFLEVLGEKLMTTLFRVSRTL